MGELETSIERVIAAYAEAVFAKDVDAFMSLYDQNVRIFDTWAEWSYEGASAWRRIVTDWLGSLGSGRVAVEMQGVQTNIGSGVATVHAFVKYKEVSSDGEELKSMTNRLTWVLSRTGDDWKIVHEHTSAPINTETMKVTLQL